MNIEIHKTAIIEETAVIIGPAYIGRNVYVGHNAIIGAPPQHHDYYPCGDKKATKGVHISEGAVIRELTQVHQGIIEATEIGYNTLIMAGCHIAHDTWIGEDCTIGSFSIFGGHTTIGDRVTLGQGVVTHPWIVVGESAMIGLNSSVTKDVAPYQKVAGSPARLLGKNTGASGDKESWDETILDVPTWERYAVMQRHRDNIREISKEKK